MTSQTRKAIGLTTQDKTLIFVHINSTVTETYKSLSVAVFVVKGYHISARSLWVKTDALMTDAASKNLKRLKG